MAETNPVFTNKFSINNVVQKNHPVTRSVQSIRLCSTVLLEQWSSEGLTNTGVPSSCSQSSCPMGRLQVGHGGHCFQSLIALPEDSFLISSVFPISRDGSGTHGSVACSTCHLEKLYDHEMILDSLITLFWSGSISVPCMYHALPLYREQENHSIYQMKPVPHISAVLEKNSYRIAPCWGKKERKGKISFWSSLLTEVFWCCYCWFLKDLMISWGSEHGSVLWSNLGTSCCWEVWTVL